MTISIELHSRIMNIVHTCVTKMLPENRRIAIPVTYRNDMKKCAGLAYCVSKRIELNIQLLIENEEAFLARTVPHEAAHIITKILFPDAKQAHGPEFRYVMTKLGCDTSTYHSYDVSSVVSGERFRYVCNCKDKAPFSISKLIHKKMVAGQSRTCRSCKGRLSYWPKDE